MATNGVIKGRAKGATNIYGSRDKLGIFQELESPSPMIFVCGWCSFDVILGCNMASVAAEKFYEKQGPDFVPEPRCSENTMSGQMSTLDGKGRVCESTEDSTCHKCQPVVHSQQRETQESDCQSTQQDGPVSTADLPPRALLDDLLYLSVEFGKCR